MGKSNQSSGRSGCATPPSSSTDENDDTDRHAAVKLQHLSPTFVLFLDKRAGEHTQHGNGEHAEISFRLDERGRLSGPLRWVSVVLPHQVRAEMRHFWQHLSSS